MNAEAITLYKFILCDCAAYRNRTFAHSHITPLFRTKECTISAQSSLKALAGAVIDRTMQRTLPAQSEKTARTLGAHYQTSPAHCNAQKTDSLEAAQIALIRSWLFRIGESVEDHHLVLDKCKADPEAMAYFLKHANGEFQTEQ